MSCLGCSLYTSFGWLADIRWTMRITIMPRMELTTATDLTITSTVTVDRFSIGSIAIAGTRPRSLPSLVDPKIDEHRGGSSSDGMANVHNVHWSSGDYRRRL